MSSALAHPFFGRHLKNEPMNEERKKLEAIGDGLLLACARLYLRDKHEKVSYQLHMRLISRIVKNTTLTEIAQGEGIRGLKDEKPADAFEVAVALRYYREGFESVRLWLWNLFDRYFDITEEVRRILEPTPNDVLTKQVRGALKMVISQQSGKITGSTLDLATKRVVAALKNGQSL